MLMMYKIYKEGYRNQGTGVVKQVIKDKLREIRINKPPIAMYFLNWWQLINNCIQLPTTK